MNIRKTIAGIAIAGVALTGLTACQQETRSDYARVCVDQRTHERVAGDRCGTNQDTASSGFLWWYLLYGSSIPRYGQPVTSGTQTLPKTRSYTPLEKAPAGSSYKQANGYKAPPVVPAKAPAQAPKPAPGVKAPAYKAPAPVYRAPAPVRVGK